MQEFPHHYQVSAKAGSEGHITLEGGDLPALETAPFTRTPALATAGEEAV